MTTKRLVTSGWLAGLAFTLIWPASIALAGSDATGDCDPPTVPVRGKLTIPNNTGQTADDLHFYMYQNDRPSVHVTGAEASTSSFGNVSVGLGTDNGQGGTPPPGNHGAQVDMDGGDVPAGGKVVIDITLCMNERNCVKFKDIEWTFTGGGGGGGGPPQPGAPNNGWRIRRPFRGGGGGNPAAQEGNGGVGRWIHIVCIENDSNNPLPVKDLKLLASMTTYADLDDVNWAAVPNVQNALGEPPVVIPPWGQWCYEFETTGPYIGGHIYLKYTVDVGGVASRAEALDEETEIPVVGDHPPDKIQDDCLEGLDLWTTVDPTALTFGTDIPAIPADFFDPGSEPFTGTVVFQGFPIDPVLFGPTDTMVRRNSFLELPEPGATGTIPIELVGLSLVSLEPIVIPRYFPEGPSLLDVLQGLTSTAPSSPPIMIGVSNDGGLSIDTELVQMSLQNPVPPTIQVEMQGNDSGGPPGIFGVDSFFDIFYNFPPGSFPSDSFFNIFVQLTTPDGLATLPMPSEPAVIHDGVGGVQIVWYTQLEPELKERHQLSMQPEISLPVNLAGVEVVPLVPGQSVFGILVNLQSDSPELVPSGAPLVHAQLQTQLMGYAFDSFFDVFVELNPELSADGSMLVTRDSLNGGTFTSQLTFTPRVIFSENVPEGLKEKPEGTVEELPGVNPLTVVQSAPMPWRYDPPPPHPFEGSGPNFWPVPETPMSWDTLNGSPHTVVASIPDGPAVAVFADSIKTHGLAGSWLIELLSPIPPSPVGVECRQGSPGTIAVTFNKPIQAVGGPDPSDVALAGGGVVNTLSVSDYTVTAEVSGMIDTGSRVTMSFPGITDGAGQPVTDTVCFGVLRGDASGDGATNIFDLIRVRNALNQPVQLNRLRADITGDGLINIFDLISTRNNLNNTVPPVCP